MNTTSSGSREKKFLKALLAYWGRPATWCNAKNGAGKEREKLSWEDARIVVFQTMLVMYEIARFIGRPPSSYAAHSCTSLICPVD